MKRIKNIFMCIIGVVLALVVSVCPRYYVYASSETPDQTVTSDDSIVQKLMDYTLSMWGAVAKTGNAASPQGVTKIGTDLQNSIKDKIATLMNGGGIYVDENGDYVFSNEASQQIYDAMMSNSNVDAKVVSDFSAFTTFSDGYVNSQFLQDCNSLVSWAKLYGSVNPSSNYTSDNYILMGLRYGGNGYIYTELYAFLLPDDFAFLNILNFSNSNYKLQVRNVSSNTSYCLYKRVDCRFTMSNSSYTNNTTSESRGTYLYGDYPLRYNNLNDIYNSFPNLSYNTDDYNYNFSYYCNNSLILSKDVVAGNSLVNQSSGVYSSYTNIGTINKNVITNNNWENIYNNYVTQVNIDYQENPDMSASDLRKIMKKYTSSIVDAITQGNENIEETISISNRYLQAISVDCRNISDKLDQIIQNGGGGGSSGGGLTEEQYNTLIGLINNINDHAVDIASNTDGSYLELQDISDNTATTNTNLVALKGVLDSINSKIRNKNTKPLPDPDFWDNLTDDLIDITDTVPEKFANAMTVIATAFKTVVPFGYIAVIGVLLSSLAEDPEEPIFEIDLQNDNGTIPLNWQGTIDLTWVADIMPIVRALECIVFIIGLIVFTFTVFNTLGSLFS